MHGCSWGVCVVAPGRGACIVAPGGACVGYDEIRSLSGRYASYWNAFLFDNKITVLVLYIISIKYFIYHFLNIAKELFLTWFCLAFEQHEK